MKNHGLNHTFVCESPWTLLERERADIQSSTKEQFVLHTDSSQEYFLQPNRHDQRTL